MKKTVLALSIVLALPTSITLAQRPGPGGPPPNQQPRDGRPPKRERERPERPERPEKPERPPVTPMPLLHVLDADHDGIIAAGEIEKAPDALGSLDKNKDGKLTRNELAPRPDGPPPGDTERPPKRETADKKRAWPFTNRKPPGDGEKAQRVADDKDGERPGQKPPGDREQRPEGGGDGERPRPHAPPLVGALDADHNGEISAGEIADSAKALLTLDKNGDGQLGPREYLGPPPGGHPEGDGDGPKPPRPPQEPE